MNLLDTRIITERLLLRPTVEEDAVQVFRHVKNPEITKYLGFKPPESIVDELDYILKTRLEMLKGTNLSVTVLKGSEFIGKAGLHDLEKDISELGIWTTLEARGNHYGVEIIGSIIQWAVENLGKKQFLYPVVKENIASRKIPERLGAEIINEFEKTFPNGKTFTTVEYLISR